MIFYDENGDEVEGFKQDELDAIIEKRKEELESTYKKQIDELSEKVKAAEESINTDTYEKDKTKNFKNLRDLYDSVSSTLEKERSEWNSKFDSLTQELSLKEIKADCIGLAKGDKELAMEIESNYLRFVKPAEGEKDDRMERAYKLAMFEKPERKLPDFVTRSGQGTPPSKDVVGTKPGQLTPAQIELGKAMGMKDEDLK